MISKTINLSLSRYFTDLNIIFAYTFYETTLFYNYCFCYFEFSFL